MDEKEIIARFAARLIARITSSEYDEETQDMDVEDACGFSAGAGWVREIIEEELDKILSS